VDGDKLQILAIIATVGLLLVVFELVRRRRLMERYALLWLGSALVLFGLAVWRGLLEDLSSALGIASPPNALFVVAFGFVVVLLLHFSMAVSRLTDENKVLAQQMARLDQELWSLRRWLPGREAEASPGSYSGEVEPASREPVGASTARTADQ
jgi:hypothetical protein